MDNEMEQAMERLTASQKALLTAQIVMNRDYEEFKVKTETSFQRVESQIADLTVAVSELAASVRVTDQNVSALVTMLQKLIEREGGQQ